MKMTKSVRAFVVTACVLLIGSGLSQAQQKGAAWSPAEDSIRKEIGGLRGQKDEERGAITKKIALEIRALPAGMNKVRLASGLASLSTEGYFGQENLQEVANALAASLEETPQPEENGEPAFPYVELANLVHFERVTTTFTGPQMDAANRKIQADEDAI